MPFGFSGYILLQKSKNAYSVSSTKQAFFSIVKVNCVC